MKRYFFLLLVLPLVALAAGEDLKTNESVSVAVVRASQPVVEQLAHGPNVVIVTARHPNGTVFYRSETHNLRTNAGADWQSAQMAGATAAVCTYIALTANSSNPAAGDTSLAGEITTGGMGRANGTYAHTAGTSSYTVSYSFAATATVSAIDKAGMFNAASSGTMCFESAVFSPVTVNNGDNLQFTWTVNY